MIGRIVVGILACLVVLPTEGQTISAGRTLTTIVLDFSNRAGKSGEPLIRTATDATAVELAGSGRYEVLKRGEVERAANALGLRPPYDAVDRSRLAKVLGADVIVTGEITFVRRDTRRKPPRTLVGLKVQVLDAETGELHSLWKGLTSRSWDGEGSAASGSISGQMTSAVAKETAAVAALTMPSIA